MATNSVSSLGSSLSGSSIDVNAIVEQLMVVEQQRLTKLMQTEAAYQAKITAFGGLLGSVSTFQEALKALKDSSELSMTASVSDSTIFTASADSDAETGSYSIKVIKLAKAQSLSLTAAVSSMAASVADFSEADASTTTQSIRITAGTGTPVVVSITPDTNTLSDFAAAINDAGAGVQASIVKTGTDEYNIVITSVLTGETNGAITIDIDKDNDGVYNEAAGAGQVDERNATGFGRFANNSDSLLRMHEVTEPLDAELYFNDLLVTRPDNTITDLIDGVTLNLLKGILDPTKPETATTVTLDLKQSADDVKAKITGLVTDYNNLMSSIKSLGSQSGSLSGDTTLGLLQRSIISSFTGFFDGRSVFDLGFSFDKTGVLSINSTKLDDALSTDPSGAVQLLYDMSSDLSSRMSEYVNTLIPNKTSGLNSSVDIIKDKEDAENIRLDTVKKAYLKQYQNLDRILSGVQVASSFLTAQTNQSNNNKD